LCALVVSLIALARAASAQEIAIKDDLAAENTSITTRVDAFGQEIQVAEGQIVNDGGAAYTGLSLTAEVYDPDGELIGEGFGFLVNACGAAGRSDVATGRRARSQSRWRCSGRR
jgi:hypothetical protein